MKLICDYSFVFLLFIQGITANAICPGWVLTDLIKKQIDIVATKNKVDFEEGARILLKEKQPSLQFVKPEQIGDMVLFICSNSASELRGEAICIDGGWTSL